MDQTDIVAALGRCLPGSTKDHAALREFLAHSRASDLDRLLAVLAPAALEHENADHLATVRPCPVRRPRTAPARGAAGRRSRCRVG